MPMRHRERYPAQSPNAVRISSAASPQISSTRSVDFVAADAAISLTVLPRTNHYPLIGKKICNCRLEKISASQTKSCPAGRTESACTSSSQCIFEDFCDLLSRGHRHKHTKRSIPRNPIIWQRVQGDKATIGIIWD